MKYLINSNQKPLLSCEQFATETGFPKDGFFQKDKIKNCQNLNSLEIKQLENPNYPHFKITGPFFPFGLTVDARTVHSASYLYHEAPLPSRLVFVEGSNKFDLIVPVENDGKVIKQSILGTVVDGDNDNGLGSYADQLLPIDELMLLIHENIQNEPLRVEDTVKDISRISQNLMDDETIIKLDKEDFVNPESIGEIEQILQNDDIEKNDQGLAKIHQ